MQLSLSRIVNDFAICLKRADDRHPQAINIRSKECFQVGIGPHSEGQTVELIAKEFRLLSPELYNDFLVTGVPYPDFPRQKCDLCIGTQREWQWAIEVKMLRMLGDNGKLNDNILMHILSPYPEHRSALTDCVKLAQSQLAARKAILIYGYEHQDWPLELGISAFESLATTKVSIGPRQIAYFDDLIHPIHSSGAVFGWEIR